MVKRVLVLSLLLAFAIGCGSGPKLVPVSGVVTLNGKPLGEAVIQFLPDPPTEDAHPADDVTDPEGNYQAETKGRSGVVPGKYRVVITKDNTPIPAAVSEQFKDDPFMAGLSSRPPDGGRTSKKKADDTKIEGVFNQEIPPEGGEFNFDVKLTSKAAAKEAAAP
jgi:hypothetical protein